MQRCLGCMKEYNDGRTVCPSCGYDQDSPAAEHYFLTPGTILQNRYIVGKSESYDDFEVAYIAYDAQHDSMVFVNEYLPRDLFYRSPEDANVTILSEGVKPLFSDGLHIYLETAGQMEKFNKFTGLPMILDSFNENSTGYIISEYIEGRTLRTILGENNVLGFQQAREITLRLLYVLENTHAAGIYHNDVNPDSIFVTKSGEVVLLGYASAKRASQIALRADTGLSPSQTALEMLAGQDIQSPQFDVYSIAAAFYYMMTGLDALKSPLSQKRAARTFPSKLGVTIPSQAETALMLALQNEIWDASHDAKALTAALTASETGRARRSALWRGITAAIIVVIVLAAGFFILNRMLDKTPNDSDETEIPTESNTEQVSHDNRTEETGVALLPEKLPPDRPPPTESEPGPERGKDQEGSSEADANTDNQPNNQQVNPQDSDDGVGIKTSEETPDAPPPSQAETSESQSPSSSPSSSPPPSRPPSPSQSPSPSPSPSPTSTAEPSPQEAQPSESNPTDESSPSPDAETSDSQENAGDGTQDNTSEDEEAENPEPSADDTLGGESASANQETSESTGNTPNINDPPQELPDGLDEP